MMHYAQVSYWPSTWGWEYQCACSCGYRSVATANGTQANGYMDQHLGQVRSGAIR